MSGNAGGGSGGLLVRVCVVRGGVVGAAWEGECVAPGWTDIVVSAAVPGGPQSPVSVGIGTLPRSALGWTLVVANKGAAPASLPGTSGNASTAHVVESEAAVSVRAHARLFLAEQRCSTVGDSAARAAARSRSSFGTGSPAEAGATAEECVGSGLSYCDNTQDSGRQLDACSVCGGGCFPPDCSAAACVERADLRYAASPRRVSLCI